MSTQVIGGSFQDILGNPIALGSITFELMQDAQVTGQPIDICMGTIITLLLDSSGNVASSPAQNLWSNTQLTPNGTFYRVSVYTANGQLVWGPNSQQIIDSSGSYNVGEWVPGIVNFTV